MDEGAGTIAHDSSTNHNDGTVYGATWTNGAVGSALSFLLMYATFGALALRYLFTLRSKGVDV